VKLDVSKVLKLAQGCFQEASSKGAQKFSSQLDLVQGFNMKFESSIALFNYQLCLMLQHESNFKLKLKLSFEASKGTQISHLANS
jgi:hypothetical protein